MYTQIKNKCVSVLHRQVLLLLPVWLWLMIQLAYHSTSNHTVIAFTITTTDVDHWYGTKQRRLSQIQKVPITKRFNKKSSTLLLHMNYNNNNNNNNVKNNNEYYDENQIKDSIQSLIDYHQDVWIGQSIQSFTISDDIAAGILHRQMLNSNNSNSNDDETLSVSSSSSFLYKSTIRIGYDMQQNDYTMKESIDCYANTNDSSTSADTTITSTIDRNIPFSLSNIDVDCVDGSYSYDSTTSFATTRSNKNSFPMNLLECNDNSNYNVQFGIEHCLACNDNQRIRCFTLYGTDTNDTQQQQQQQQQLQLIRIVLCTEHRLPSNQSSQQQQQQDDQNIQERLAEKEKMLTDLQPDVDRIVSTITNKMLQTKQPNTPFIDVTYDTMDSIPVVSTTTSTDKDPIDRLLESINNNSNNIQQQQQQQQQDVNNNNNNDNEAYNITPITLVDVTSGEWVGDAVIRDQPSVYMSPIVEQVIRRQEQGQKGFGNKRLQDDIPNNTIVPFFGNWIVGVQKVISKFIWNNYYNNNDYNNKIQYTTEYGKILGIPISDTIPLSLIGTICSNEHSIRRKYLSIPSNEKIVYISYDTIDTVGFIIGSSYIQVPRRFSFSDDRTQLRPFYTEFCVFQSTSSSLSTTTVQEQSTNANNDKKEQQQQQLVCSKIARLYNYQGKLKQGITSFLSLQRDIEYDYYINKINLLKTNY